MGCHHAKTSKTSPDFYYQTSAVYKEYLGLSEHIKIRREAIFDAVGKNSYLKNQDISLFQDNEKISEAISKLKLSKDTAQLYPIEQEYRKFFQAHAAIQLELSDISQQHKILLKKIRSKQPPLIEQLLVKMENLRNSILLYYRVKLITNKKVLEEEKNNTHFTTQFSSNAYSIRTEE